MCRFVPWHGRSRRGACESTCEAPHQDWYYSATALNIGPGCFDDVEFLLDETLRAQFTAEALAAYDEKNESLFRIVTHWLLCLQVLLLKLGPHFGARRLEGGGQFAQSSLLLRPCCTYRQEIPTSQWLRVCATA